MAETVQHAFIDQDAACQNQIGDALFVAVGLAGGVVILRQHGLREDDERGGT